MIDNKYSSSTKSVAKHIVLVKDEKDVPINKRFLRGKGKQFIDLGYKYSLEEDKLYEVNLDTRVIVELEDYANNT